MALSYTQAVRKGARLLDETQPGWQYKVKITDLDLKSIDDCPLGQVYGNYWDGVKALFNNADERLRFVPQSVLHGFCRPARSDYFTSYPRLTELWADEVRKRRGRSGTRGKRKVVS